MLPGISDLWDKLPATLVVYMAHILKSYHSICNNGNFVCVQGWKCVIYV